jgi:hypothetical protein
MTTDLSREALLASLAVEREALLALLPRFSDVAWRSVSRADGWTPHDITTHLADATYGLALITLGELPPPAALDATGWMQVDALNQQRREKNAALSREKAMSRLASSFDHARRAVEQTDDLAAPGPTGPQRTKGNWLERMILHNRIHREELAALLKDEG